jgi:type IV pilus assembly protein PilW
MKALIKQHDCNRQHCRGFSMVELMVALLLTLILLGGMSQIFLGFKRSFSLQDSLARQQENGRYVIETLGRDLRRAGYMGALNGPAAIGGTEGKVPENGTCPGDDNSWGRMLDSRIYGLNDTNSGYGCVPAANHLRGDILVVRYQAPWIAGGSRTPGFEDERLYLRTSFNMATLFRGKDASNMANSLAGVRGRSAELIARAYYVGPSSSGSCDGVAVPALFRESLNDKGLPVAEEIAYGIDNLQLRYGVDLDGDESVDRYLDAGDPGLDAPGDWGAVINAQVWVLTRSECPETGFDTTGKSYAMGDVHYEPVDTAKRGYRRQLYQTTVTLRNPEQL